MRVFVMLAHGRALPRWQARYEVGEVNDASPYSFGRATELGCSVAFSADFPEGRIAGTVRPGARRPPWLRPRAGRHRRDPHRALREAYAWADVVLLPLEENLHVSGIPVALEAVAARRPVVATRTGGVDARRVAAAATRVGAAGCTAAGCVARRVELSRRSLSVP